MVMSRQEFNRNAETLVTALRFVDYDSSNNSSAASGSLGRWELQNEDDSNIYLVHPAVIVHHRHVDAAGSQQPGEAEDDSSFVDDNIHTDDAVHQHPMTATECENTQWNFSVVYSETFQVPVLYFHAQRPNGEPCSRSEILQWLKPKLIGEDDSWEFLSQEQHPWTGLPSFFLHPCQTPHLLKTMTMTNQDEKDRCNVLWAWLSMILVPVGHPIPSDFYLRVQQQVQKSVSAAIDSH